MGRVLAAWHHGSAHQLRVASLLLLHPTPRHGGQMGLPRQVDSSVLDPRLGRPYGCQGACCMNHFRLDQPRTPALPLQIVSHLLGAGNQLHPAGLHQPALTLSHRTPFPPGPALRLSATYSCAVQGRCLPWCGDIGMIRQMQRNLTVQMHAEQPGTRLHERSETPTGLEAACHLGCNVAVAWAQATPRFHGIACPLPEPVQPRPLPWSSVRST